MSRALLILRSDAIRAKACQQCGVTFEKDTRNTWAYWERAKYCSQACAGLAEKARRARLRPSLADALRTRTNITDGCWEWTGAKDKGGYGVFGYEGRQRKTHVVALEIDGRPVPKGKYACHACDNPSCVRPDHLYVGTPTQNMADAIARGRVARGERRSPLSASDVMEIRASRDDYPALAAKYGVSRSAISMVRTRRTWRHIP